jgi:colicin import membrane protein
MQRDLFMPQPLAGRGLGVALALLAHGLLLLALTLAVNWRVSTPSPIEAELWAEIPRAAPPVVVRPPPPVEPEKPVLKPPEPRNETKPPRAVPDAQIAIEKAKREKEREEIEKKRKEEEKKLAEKKADLERKQKEKEAQLAREEAQRKKILEGIVNDANKQSSSGGPTSGDPGADYRGQIQKYIRDNVSFPPNAEVGTSAEVRIFLTPTGRVLNQQIIRSSGNSAFDSAVLRDVQKSEKLPTPRTGPAPSPMDVVVTK